MYKRWLYLWAIWRCLVPSPTTTERRSRSSSPSRDSNCPTTHSISPRHSCSGKISLPRPLSRCRRCRWRCHKDAWVATTADSAGRSSWWFSWCAAPPQASRLLAAAFAVPSSRSPFGTFDFPPGIRWGTQSRRLCRRGCRDLRRGTMSTSRRASRQISCGTSCWCCWTLAATRCWAAVMSFGSAGFPAPNAASRRRSNSSPSSSWWSTTSISTHPWWCRWSSDAAVSSRWRFYGLSVVDLYRSAFRFRWPDASQWNLWRSTICGQMIMMMKTL